ncbi:MAG: insulinase family protein [SAR202 cluster bacterium]|nr:insulinase family protein [SAR202 cluster bacterium]
MATSTIETRQTCSKTTLDSGIRVITSEMPHTQSVTICIFVGVGSRNETDEQSGISHFVEHMVFKGTHRRPTPKDVSGVIEGVGGILNAETDHEYTGYWCRVPRPDFKESLDLLVDMLRDSRLDSADVEKERGVVIEELGMVRDNPEYKVEALIDEMLWPSHPLGREVGGTRETVSAFTREAVQEYMARYYTASNIVLSVAGNVTHDEVLREASRLLAGWPNGKPPHWTPFKGTQSAPAVRVAYRKTEQVYISLAMPGIHLTHPDRYNFDILSVIMGEGTSSRLFLEVRERLGLAYDVHSGVTHFRDCGAFFVNAGVAPKKVADSVEAIMGQVAKAKELVPDDELEMAKRLTTGRLMLRMEDTRAVSHWFGAQELLMGEVHEASEVARNVKAVTSEGVQRIAKELLRPDGLNLAVVGPCRSNRRLERIVTL